MLKDLKYHDKNTLLRMVHFFKLYFLTMEVDNKMNPIKILMNMP